MCSVQNSALNQIGISDVEVEAMRCRHLNPNPSVGGSLSSILEDRRGGSHAAFRRRPGKGRNIDGQKYPLVLFENRL